MRIIFITLLTLLANTAIALADVKVASWNIMRLNAEKDERIVLDILNKFDLIALQEVMNIEYLAELVGKLNSQTGEEWKVMASHLIGRGSYKESYAYIWRTSAVEYTGEAIVYLDDRDVFAREPIAAKFRSTEAQFDFVLANIHVLYGKSKSDRIPEIKALDDYWLWLSEVYPKEQIFLVGDFNMPSKDKSFDELKRFANAMIGDTATTLSTKEGKFANAYDNIWYPNTLAAEISVGVLNFPAEYGLTNNYSRKMVSDHIPVYFIVSQINEHTGYIDPSKTLLPTTEATSKVLGNKNSKIYHLPTVKVLRK